MRLPRVRFTVRRLMVAVAALGVGMGLLCQRDTDEPVSLGVGHVRIPIVFLVTDSDSGQPIEGAEVRLRDRDFDSNPVSPYALDLKTGPDGRATVLEGWPFGYAEGVGSGRLLSYHVGYPRWEMTFTAEGYRPATGEFTRYERGDRRFHDPKGAPPPVVVHLGKLSRPVVPKGASSGL